MQLTCVKWFKVFKDLIWARYFQSHQKIRKRKESREKKHALYIISSKKANGKLTLRKKNKGKEIKDMDKDRTFRSEKL